MSTTLTTKSTVKVSNLGHDEKQTFDFAAVLGLTGSKTTNGITYRAEAAENTITGKGVAAQGVLGPYVELQKSQGLKGYGLLTGTLGYNTGRKGFLAKLKHRYRNTELGAEYSDVTKQAAVDASIKPHPANKLTASYNVTKDVARAKHTLTTSAFQLVTSYPVKPAQPPAVEATRILPRDLGTAMVAHSLASGATALEHTSRLLPKVGGVLTTAYGVQQREVALSWTQQLCTLGLVTRVAEGRLTHPTLSLTLEKSYTDFGQLGGLKPRRQQAASQPSALAGSGAAAAAGSRATEAKLKSIDEAYQNELARLNIQKEKQRAAAASKLK